MSQSSKRTSQPSSELASEEYIKNLEEVLESLVDWAESGRTTIGRPGARSPRLATQAIIQIIEQAKTEVVKRYQELQHEELVNEIVRAKTEARKSELEALLPIHADKRIGIIRTRIKELQDETR